MRPTANIVIEDASPAFDRMYSYLIPPHLEDDALPGCRVRIPFGRGNRLRTGLILAVEESSGQEPQLKEIQMVLDPRPLLGEEGLWLLRCIKEQTFCLWFDALRLLVPAGLGIASRIFYRATGTPFSVTHLEQESILGYLEGQTRPVSREKLCEALSIQPGDPHLRELVRQGAVEEKEELRQRVGDETRILIHPTGEDLTASLTPRQQEVLDFLVQSGPATVTEIHACTGATRPVIDALEFKGAVHRQEITLARNPYEGREEEEAVSPPLSPEQERIYRELSGHRHQEEPSPALLYGVTGSGKTQVFLRLVEDVIGGGAGVIVMVPEISLASQTVALLQNRFGSRVAVLHSGLSLGERMDEWRRIRDGGADIVVGTRSAVFAPLQRIGLIVIDEEQEHTYKSDQSPRYHARDVARLRCRFHKSLLLLSSATPSVESYHAAKEGRWKLVQLTERFGDAALPDVYIIAMGDPENISLSPHLSDPLLQEIRYNLEHGEQSILLLNRRGYSTLVRCPECGSVAECPNCSVSLTYHMAADNLACHYCGYTTGRLADCPHCGGGMMRYTGTGTQKLEEELSGLFPEARILRMDMDTTGAKFAHDRMFRAFAAGEYDILIGTQMVAKGLNFPKVTLVGVIMADQSLYSGDFRGYERSFALLTQVAGRSGRGEHPGRALIQTWSPDHPIIQLASRQDYPSFYREEIKSRELHVYPPFCTIAGIGFVGEVQKEVEQAAAEFADFFAHTARERYPKLPLLVLGPSPADVLRVAGRFRYRLLVKCRNNAPTRELISIAVAEHYKKQKSVSVFVDMYYDRM